VKVRKFSEQRMQDTLYKKVEPNSGGVDMAEENDDLDMIWAKIGG
jgi:hypothetical protein